MKDKITIISFIIIIYGCLISSIIIKDKDISLFERRPLKTTKDLKKDFIDNFEDYVTDQFPIRNEMISLNDKYNRNILNNKIYNDVYVEDGIIYNIDNNINKKSIDNFIKKINYINKNYLENSNVYLTVIPDKSWYLKDEIITPNYNDIINDIKEGIDIPYINLTNDFNESDFYKTDIHIKQESYLKIIEKLIANYGISYFKENYKYNDYYPFYGASYSKVGNIKPDTLTYLTNNYTNSAKVNHLEYGKKDTYDLTELGSVDSYNVFLNGPSALIEIEGSSKNNKELIIFRDSYASSLAPLLIPYYEKITLIDLRYISFDLVKDTIDFKDKDVLFMYSSLVINNSSILKVNN